MTITFRPAARGNEPIRLGLAGPSRSGKTKSALRIARGMVGGENRKIFGINTEPGGMTLYADDFSGFMCAELGPPFSPSRYREAMESAVKADAGVAIVDSMSHEHDGEGGILSMHDAELQRMAGNDYAKRERMTFSAWIKPKAQHNEFVQFVLRCPIPVIYCFRAREKLKLVKDQEGKIKPVPQGYQPIVAADFEYEMHSLILLGENSKGIPDLKAQATGLRQPVDQFLAEAQGKSLDEKFGERLAEWARGSTAAATPSRTGNSASDLSPGRFVWITSRGKTEEFSDATAWEQFVAAGIAKSSVAAVKAARQRNAAILVALPDREAALRVSEAMNRKAEQTA